MALEIVSAIVAALAAQFAKDASKPVVEKGKQIWDALAKGFKGDPEAERALKRYENNPTRNEIYLEDLLNEKLPLNDKLFNELRRVLLSQPASQSIQAGGDYVGRDKVDGDQVGRDQNQIGRDSIGSLTVNNFFDNQKASSRESQSEEPRSASQPTATQLKFDPVGRWQTRAGSGQIGNMVLHPNGTFQAQNTGPLGYINATGNYTYNPQAQTLQFQGHINGFTPFMYHVQITGQQGGTYHGIDSYGVNIQYIR